MVSTVPMSVLYSTSYDMTHPPSNICDNDEATFWMTTGLYPQEVAFKFSKPIQITRITIVCGKAKNVVMYSATNPELTEWVQVDSYKFESKPVKQQDTHKLNMQSASYGLKVEILQGWDAFSAIYLIRVDGPTVRFEE